jgi:predicted acyltransferase
MTKEIAEGYGNPRLEPLMPANDDRPMPKDVRLTSLDALRGFDMFWIMGGMPVVLGMVALSGNEELLKWCQTQQHHVAWNGFHFEDLIFPLFLFLAGVAIPFSLLRHQERGERSLHLHLHVIRRCVLLVLLGIIYNGLLQFRIGDPDYPRLASVLGNIGMAYCFAAIIALHAGPRWRFLWMIGILVGYCLAMLFIPVPGFGAGNLEPGKNLANYIDLCLLPGKPHRPWGDPEGLLVKLPATATALLGVLAGDCLRNPARTGGRKVFLLAAAAGLCLGLGYLWDPWFPINKALWTSSFALVAGGYSLALLAVFYLVIDVWGWRRWAFPFVVIGMNSITIYMASGIIDFGHIPGFFFAGGLRCLTPTLTAWNSQLPALLTCFGVLLAKWAFLYFLYCKKIFLRV